MNYSPDELVTFKGQIYVDRGLARIQEDSLRIEALLSVKDEYLIPLRDSCLEALGYDSE